MSTAARPPFPLRTIHLDFHTGPNVPEVGAKFDATRFADTMAGAGVDSVTLFAKCHHGHLYYGTSRPERHPGLDADLDLLDRQVEALQGVGIRTPIYLSVRCDEYAANAHPEWIALDENNRQVKWGYSAYTAGWQILDMSSPYQDYLAEQIGEVVDRFAPLDGMFLDMCWDQPSSSIWTRRAMESRGMNPADPAEQALYARQNVNEFMARFRDQVEPHLADDVASGVWFNSRAKTALAEESHLVRHVEIESLPTGGWGYAYFPYVSRFVRPLGKPTLSHTGRFYKSWGDNGGLKPRAALMYECTQILAQGMTSGVGDLLHPTGELNPASYELIGSVYHHIEACEPFVDGTAPVAEVAVVVDPALGDAPGAAGFGMVRALQQLRAQFDILPPAASLDGYAVVVVPETTEIDDALAAKLATHTAAGGRVLVCRGARSGWFGVELLDLPGITLGDESPFSHVFLRDGGIATTTPTFDHVMYDRTLRMSVGGDAESLIGVVEPYFERAWDHFSGHEYTPPSGKATPWSAVARSGRVIVAAAPMFEAIGNHGAPAYREIVGACLERLLPAPAVRVGGPVHLEASLVSGPGALVLHLISFVPTRVADSIVEGQPHAGLDVIEDPFPVVDVPVQIRYDREPSAVRLQPSGEDLDWDWADGYLTLRVTVLDGHAMVVVSR